MPVGVDQQIEGDQLLWRPPLLGVLLAFVCLLTIAGNCLVVIAVCTRKALRNPTGYLIVSLAVADLIVGLLVMPLNSLFEMSNHVWLLGLAMCDVFHALDILASTSSIWSLCVISIDRYLAGQDPLRYREKVSKRRILFAIGTVWIMSAVLSLPAILWWRNSSPHLYLNQRECHFTDNSTYVLFSALISFYIPLMVILFAYGHVFLIATKHTKSLRSGRKAVKYRASESLFVSEETAPTLRIHVGGGSPAMIRCAGMSSSPNSTRHASLVSSTDLAPHPFKDSPRGSAVDETCAVVRRRMGVRERSRQMMRMVQEQRAARTLSIVVGVFILCWTPFFVSVPLMALCNKCASETLFTWTTWAGHLNSLLNPLIYTRFSREFRRAFRQTLTCHRERRVGSAIKTPLSIVLAQLISILWQDHTSSPVVAATTLNCSPSAPN